MGTLRGTDDWDDLKLPVPHEAVAELVARGYVDPDVEVIPPAVITPVPVLDRRSKHFEKGAFFDVDEVCRVIDAMRDLRHTKTRRWAGRPFEPEAFQVLYVIAPVFGWRRPDPESGSVVRIIRTVWIEVARKNGKSTLASALLIILLLADREVGAEVYAAAASRDQAGAVFEPFKQMLRSSPRVRGMVKVLGSLVRAPRTGSFARVLSKLADVAHGLNVHAAVVDEVHVHKSRDLLDAIESGTGGREQPIVIKITTSDDGSKGTIFDEQHTEIELLALDLTEPDHSQYGVIWAVPEGLDPFDIENVKQANPGFGVTITEEYLRKQITKARRTPSYMPAFERLHCNRRRRPVARAIDMEQWDRCGRPAMTVSEMREELRGRRCFGGLDLSSTSDFTAWGLVFPDEFEMPDGSIEEGCWLLPRLWIPEAAAEKHTLRTTFEAWAADGWLTITEGDTVDFGVIEAGILEDRAAFDVEEFAFDPWEAEMLRQRLLDAGLVGWKCTQQMSSLAPGTQEFDRLLGRGLIYHGGNPPLAWMASNVVSKVDAMKRWKPEKKLSPEKIDGFAAEIMAIAAWRRADREAKATPGTARAVAVGAEGPSSVFRPSGRLRI